MKAWTIKYWPDTSKKNTIEYWFDQLTKEELKTISQLVKLLELCGNKLKMPHSKPLKSGLFELRDKKYGFRIYYCFQSDQLIVLLIAGDKASQQKDISVARQRLTILKTKRTSL